MVQKKIFVLSGTDNFSFVALLSVLRMKHHFIHSKDTLSSCTALTLDYNSINNLNYLLVEQAMISLQEIEGYFLVTFNFLKTKFF